MPDGHETVFPGNQNDVSEIGDVRLFDNLTEV